MTDAPARTVLARMTAAGIIEDRALAHIAAGVVRVDSTVVTDPGQDIGVARWVIGPAG